MFNILSDDSDTLLASYPQLAPRANDTNAAVLGIGTFGHDAAASLIEAKSGRVLFAVAEERLTNRKHDWHFPVGAIDECCQVAAERGMTLESVAVNFRADEFVTKTWFQEIGKMVPDPVASQSIRDFLSVQLSDREYLSVDRPTDWAHELLAHLQTLGLDQTTNHRLLKRMTWYWNWAVKYGRIADTITRYVEGVPIRFFNHHESHAASAYFNSGFESATVIVIDGMGEADTVSVYRAESGSLTRVSESSWPHSLGIFYLFATQHLGFQLGDEYKVMGMSAYGKPTYRDALRDMISVDSQARLCLHDTDYLKLGELGPHGHLAYQFTEAFHKLLPQRSSEDPIEQQHFDFSASVQELTEKTGVELVQQAIALTGLPNVALAGGVALNGLMNEAIRTHSGCDGIFVYPAAADDGCAVGAAQLAANESHSIGRQRIKSCYFGHEVTDAEAVETIRRRSVRATRPDSIHEEIARALAEGKIVARCTSRAEFGPRALGHRSLLAHPGLATMKETLNARVKHREEFRPFAPACLRERVSEFFEIHEESPFMLLIGQAREKTRELAPSVVHADGTARVQTVCQSENEDLYKIITHFEKLTGLPIVINTSFNVNGESIVDTAEDALESFGYMDVDYLALGDHWISKEENPSILPQLSSDDYLSIRKQRFSQRNLGPLTQLDVAEFDQAFSPSEESLRRFVSNHDANSKQPAKPAASEVPKITPQQLDDLSLFPLREDPDLWERLIEAENENAKSDPVAAKVLESVYWESDRDLAFRRFHESLDFQSTLKLLRLMGIDKNQPTVEIGGGSGFLSWALSQEGYQDISLLEPNPNYITGTGYLRSRPDATQIEIEHSLDAFYESDKMYQTVITRNCVHHFPNIAFVAAAIRQKMAPGGKWVMIREPFVESATELYQFLQGHPYSQAYGVYEFGFPASHFVQCLELAGLRLRSVVPAHYANNSLGLYSNDRGSRRNRIFSDVVDRVLSLMPGMTKLGYQAETMLRGLIRTRAACFTRPQVMTFQRVELDPISESTIWYRPQSKLPDQLDADHIAARNEAA